MRSYRLKHTACALLATIAFATPLPAHAEDAASISALLKEKTQLFSDAGQRGDGKAMAAMLDDRVVFFNEGGDVATKADMASATPSPPDPAVKTVMTVTDWHCEVHGDVAVASFIDDQQRVNHGEPFHARYRSVETWRKAPEGWLMIGSETIALIDDPATVTLAPALLAQYVGTYRDAAGDTLTFRWDGDHLISALNNNPATVQVAEVADVLFTPGRYRIRKVFQRDAAGHITGLQLRREGHDTHFVRV